MVDGLTCNMVYNISSNYGFGNFKGKSQVIILHMLLV